MEKTITIGRNGNQNFKIDDKTYTLVHNEHARITITDDGRWFLEDLKSGAGNGVYVKNEIGVFERIVKQQITSKSMIRLGPESANSFIFPARHIENSENYKPEFKQLKKMDQELADEGERLEKEVKRHQMIGRLAPTIGMAAMCLPLDKTALSPMVLRVIIMVVSVAVTWLLGSGDSEKMKAFRLKRERLIVCPHCEHALSKYELKMGRCLMCKTQ